MSIAVINQKDVPGHEAHYDHLAPIFHDAQQETDLPSHVYRNVQHVDKNSKERQSNQKPEQLSCYLFECTQSTGIEQGEWYQEYGGGDQGHGQLAKILCTETRSRSKG